MKYILTFLLLVVVSIVEASPAPDWVLGRGHPSYSPDQYLIGVGFSKDNTVSASESARAELIKSISVKVNSTIRDYNSTDKSFSEATISSESDFLLEGSQVKDGWYDEDKGIFYSLVVIKRQYVLDTLSEIINNIVSRNALTLRQADTFYNNGNIVKALVYYYDGYVESSKLFPYIQTYKSVIIEPNNSVLETNHNLLFKEKIQNIVDHIEIEKVSGSIENRHANLNVKVTYKGRGIDNFPIKFYSVYKHHVERVLCKKEGCGVLTPVEGVVNSKNRIYLKAVPDFKTFTKYFTYKLNENLFTRMSLLGVSFQDTVPDPKGNMLAKQKYWDYMNKLVERRNNRSQNKSDAMSNQMRNEVNRMRPRNNDIDLSPLWNMNVPRRRGNFNFNIGFGNRRNRGNINIFRRW